MRFSGVIFRANHVTRRPRKPIPLRSLKLLRCCSIASFLGFFTTHSESSIASGSLTSIILDNTNYRDDALALGRTLRHVGGSIVNMNLSTDYWWSALGLSG